MKKNLILILFIFFVSYTFSENIKVTFVNPDTNKSYFWNLFTDFMKASAKDLDIDLTVIYNKCRDDRFENRDNLEKVILGKEKPDYLVYIFRAGIGKEILNLAEENSIKSFIVNTKYVGNENIGKARERFKNWIGHIYPDDELAGYDLLKFLSEQFEKNKHINILSLSGSMESSASFERNRGFQRALKENENLHLKQAVFTNWKRKTAKLKTSLLLRRYKNINIIWAASDEIALGAIEAIKEEGKIPSKHIVVGGMDWSKKGLKSIEKNELELSLGKHFIEGALALILIKDYHNNIDFKDELSPTIKTNLAKLDKENIKIYQKYFSDKNWDKINFKNLSKYYNKNLKAYNFSLENLINQIE